MQTVPQANPEDKSVDTDPWCIAVAQRAGQAILRELARLPWDDPDTSQLRNMELAARRILRVVGAVLVNGMAAESLQRSCVLRPQCPSCQRPMEAQIRARHQMGLVGAYTLERAVYRCRSCHTTAVPADEMWALGPSVLAPALTEVVAAQGAETPSFARTARMLERCLGIKLPPKTVERITEAIGAVAENEQQAAMAPIQVSRQTEDPQAGAKAREEAPPLPDGAPTLLVGADGGRLHADGDWREVKVAVVAPLGPSRRPDPHTGRAPLTVGLRRYVAGIESADPFFDRVATALDEVWTHPPQPVRILAIGDGGPWIWDRVQSLAAPGDDVAEILDLYHAREHLAEVGRTMFKQPEKVEVWSKQLGDTLRDHGPDPVLKALHALTPRGTTQRKTVRNCIAYFTEHRHRMDYPTYAAKGWPLGSGIVESSVRLVSNIRTKEPGMRWSRRGVQSVLSLRALLLSTTGAWDEFWNRTPQRRTPLVRNLTHLEEAA